LKPIIDDIEKKSIEVLGFFADIIHFVRNDKKCTAMTFVVHFDENAEKCCPNHDSDSIPG